MSFHISKYDLKKLSEYAAIQPGFAFKSNRFTDDPSDVALVKGENLQQGFIDWAASKYWPVEDADNHKKYDLEVGDIVLAMDRPWVTAGLKWAYIKDHDPKSLLVQRVARLRVKKGLDQTYLRCLISSGYFSNYIQPIVTGVNVPHISGKQIGDFKIPLPPPPIQKKIAAILSAYDDLIENNKRRIALLEKMAEEIYREWFVRMRFPGHEKATFVKGVPEGWEVRPFSELVEINPPERIDKGEEKPFVGMGDLSLASMFFEHKEMRKGSSGSKFRNGDVLFPRITPSLENGKRGFVMTLADGQVGFGSTEFIVLREKVIGPEHIYLLSCSSGFRKHAELSMTGASGRQRVKEDCFTFFLLKTPPPDLRNQFSDTMKPFFSEIKLLAQQIANLAQTRDLLLPRLISGKRSVEDLDIQFPPSMQDEAAPAAEAKQGELFHA